MKKTILVKGPALSMSGYGEQARFALRTLREHEDKFEIFLQNIPWGKTGHIVENTEEFRWFNFLMMKTQQYTQQNGKFDISLQVTIPNEFEKIANVNIGYTAGIETTKVAPHWIDKARIMDKIIVVSNHSKQVFDVTEYKLQNKDTGQIIDFRNTTPVEVVHFPVKKIKPKQIELNLQTDFNFLSVVQWGPRKNAEATIISFLEEFKNDENVGLVMKVNHSKNCIMDRVICERRLESIKKNHKDAKCKVYLLHGNMTEEEMTGLYSHPKIKAIVSTTHGEGFGLPLFEAVCAGLPVIAPKWSGHVDFLMAPVKEDGKEKLRNHFTTIDFDLGNVNKEAVWEGVIQPDAQWCFVKSASVKSAMRNVVKNISGPLAKAKKLQEYILQEFNEEKQKQKFVKILGINLNILNKIEKINGISFCIPTNGKRVLKTLNTIKSIQKQEWNNHNIPYEIILAGDVEAFSKNNLDLILIDKKEESHSRKVSILRNTAAANSKHETIVWLDDDILLDKEWLTKFVKYSNTNKWLVTSNKIFSPDETRYWDRSILNPHVMVDYEHSETDKNLYQTSCFMCVRKRVFENVKWDETKLVYADRQGEMPEDVKYSLDLIYNNIPLSFDQNNLVWHDDDSYTEFISNSIPICLKKETITKHTGNNFFLERSQKIENLIRSYQND